MTVTSSAARAGPYRVLRSSGRAWNEVQLLEGVLLRLWEGQQRREQTYVCPGKGGEGRRLCLRTEAEVN